MNIPEKLTELQNYFKQIANEQRLDDEKFREIQQNVIATNVIKASNLVNKANTLFTDCFAHGMQSVRKLAINEECYGSDKDQIEALFLEHKADTLDKKVSLLQLMLGRAYNNISTAIPIHQIRTRVKLLTRSGIPLFICVDRNGIGTASVSDLNLMSHPIISSKMFYSIHKKHVPLIIHSVKRDFVTDFIGFRDQFSEEYNRIINFELYNDTLNPIAVPTMSEISMSGTNVSSMRCHYPSNKNHYISRIVLSLSNIDVNDKERINTYQRSGISDYAFVFMYGKDNSLLFSNMFNGQTYSTCSHDTHQSYTPEKNRQLIFDNIHVSGILKNLDLSVMPIALDSFINKQTEKLNDLTDKYQALWFSNKL